MDKPLKDWTLEEVQETCKKYLNGASIYVEDCTCYKDCPFGTLCTLNFYYKPDTWDVDDAT